MMLALTVSLADGPTTGTGSWLHQCTIASVGQRRVMLYAALFIGAAILLFETQASMPVEGTDIRGTTSEAVTSTCTLLHMHECMHATVLMQATLYVRLY